jgi:hypothetical protein
VVVVTSDGAALDMAVWVLSLPITSIGFTIDGPALSSVWSKRSKNTQLTELAGRVDEGVDCSPGGPAFAFICPQFVIA